MLDEKRIVEDPDLPVSGYNYTAIRDRLRDHGVDVSVTTIIKRAKQNDCHKPRKKRNNHDREVLTGSIGALIQHAASLHLWARLANKKWYLITSIDDFSLKLLYADFEFVTPDLRWETLVVFASKFHGVYWGIIVYGFKLCFLNWETGHPKQEFSIDELDEVIEKETFDKFFEI